MAALRVRVVVRSRRPCAHRAGPGAIPSTSRPPATTDSGQPALGVDAAGNATVVWTRYDGAHNIIETTTRDSAGVWSPVQPLSQMGQDAIYPSVAVDPAGTATALWARFDSTRYIAQSSTRTAPGGLWSAPVNLSHTLLSVSNTHVATSASGRVVATWSAEPDGAPSRVQAAIRAPGAAWGPGVDLSDTTADAIQPRLVVAADGAATVVWNWFNGAVNIVQGASAPVGAAFGAAVTLSSDAARDAFQPRLAVDSHGDVAVFWSDVGPVDHQANYRAYDVAGPAVSSLTAPAAGIAGKASSFSASATDTWSSVASYAWSFGDGTTATGASTSHTYTAKGTYAVTLTVTDAVGNSTTRTATTAVAAPVPLIALFKLKKKTIATDEKTKLKVRLNTASTLKVVLKSKHRHLVKGKKKYLKVVLTKRLPAGTSKITIKGKKLAPDTWKVVGTAKNSTGTSPKKKAKLDRGPSRQGLDSGHLNHPGEDTWRRRASAPAAPVLVRRSLLSSACWPPSWPRAAADLAAGHPTVRVRFERPGGPRRDRRRRQRDGRVARQHHGPLVLPPGRRHVVAPCTAVGPRRRLPLPGDRGDPGRRGDGRVDARRPLGPVLQFATRQGGGAWSAPADVFTSLRVAGEFAVATDPAGTVTVVYLHPTGGSSSTVEVTTKPVGGAWSDPLELSAAGFHEQPVVVADASGRVTAAWGAIGVLESRQRPAGGSWSTTAPVGDGLWPDLGVDAAGNVTAAWQGPAGVISTSSMPPGGTWSPTQPLTAGSPDAGSPQVTVAASGATMVTWSSFETDTYVPRAAYRPPGGVFGPGVALRTSDKGAVAPDVAAAGGGFVAVWDEGNMLDGYTAFGARFTGAWSPATPLLPHDGFEARVAGAPNGDAVAVLAGSRRPAGRSRRSPWTSADRPSPPSPPRAPEPRTSPSRTPPARSTHGQPWRRTPGRSATAPRPPDRR